MRRRYQPCVRRGAAVDAKWETKKRGGDNDHSRASSVPGANHLVASVLPFGEFVGSKVARWFAPSVLLPFLTLLFVLLPGTGTSTLLGINESGGLRAQVIVDADYFFGLPGTEPVAQPATTGRYRAPWIERTEVRTETREFDLPLQRYTLRLIPNTPGKARAQADLARLHTARPAFDVGETQCDERRRRHEDWLDLYFIDRELTLTEGLDSVLADRATVLDRQTAALDFDWSELIDLRRSRTDLALRLLRLQTERRTLLERYGLTAAVLDFSGFPTPEQLSQSRPAPQIALDAKTTYELELIAAEINLERAEQRQYVDFLQAEYRGPQDDLFRERFSVGLGLQLPTDGNRKLKIRELEMGRDRLRNEAARQAEQDRQRGERDRFDFVAALQTYRSSDALLREEAEDLRQIARGITRRDGFDPLLLLGIAERARKNDLRLLDARREVYDAYLEWREVTLCGSPVGERLW